MEWKCIKLDSLISPSEAWTRLWALYAPKSEEHYINVIYSLYYHVVIKLIYNENEPTVYLPQQKHPCSCLCICHPISLFSLHSLTPWAMCFKAPKKKNCEATRLLATLSPQGKDLQLLWPGRLLHDNRPQLTTRLSFRMMRLLKCRHTAHHHFNFSQQ